MKRRFVNDAGRRGFTLVELMVAVIGAFFVSIAVFSLAKYSSSFYTRESRVADATLATLIGFERIRADIARAGFLGTPNIARDPRFCGRTADAGYPAWLARLSSVTIEPNPGTLSTEMTKNGTAPRSLVLTGSYTSADQFEVRVIRNETPQKIVLEPNSLGMANIGYPSSQTVATLERVFQPNRALRVVDDLGRIQFVTIGSVTAGAEPTILLAAQPPLQFRDGNALNCGVRDLGSGYTVNVVNIIRYELVDLSEDEQFAAMFPEDVGPSYDATRMQLIREELNVAGTAIDSTRELIADYVIDFDFSLLVERSRIALNLERITGSDTDAFASNPNSAAMAVTGPQLIRGVHFWLSVRSQEADRDTALDVDNSATYGPNLLRASVNPEGGPPFARVRTLQTNVSLNNQANLTWY